MSEIAKRIRKFRQVMEENGIDVYVVPTGDYHHSEFLGEHFKEREFITGFTGSAGTAVITKDEAGLWTDGRYFIQATEQLKDSPVRLFKMGEPKVPDIWEYLEKTLKKGGTIGFDGRTVSIKEGVACEKIAKGKGGRVSYEKDLLGKIWKDRPEMSKEKAFLLEEKYTGESAASKLSRIRAAMKEKGASLHIITALDEICWILNMRGDDVRFSPVVFSYGLISEDKMALYVDEEKFSSGMKEELEKLGVVFHPYNDIYADIRKIGEGEKALLDPSAVNYAIAKNIPEGVKQIKAPDPAILFKAVKNETEIANIRRAEIKDSICHVRFMKWLKENYNKEEITELSAAKYLEGLRKNQGNYIEPSFAPICAIGPHAAIIHYEPCEETNLRLEGGNLFLTDTGAHYKEGTTDITRTYALGEVEDAQKEHFTLVAMSNLRLANAKFLYGSTGLTLDILARQPFWERGLDYKHGTGHGVGYLLNVHEGPSGFRWKMAPGNDHVLENGMLLTDEPGIYIEGSHGIRLENEVLVRFGETNEYGQFMRLEILTFVPFDLDAIKPSLMREEDRQNLNAYHRKVYEKISPYLKEEEKEWLRKYTREI